MQYVEPMENCLESGFLKSQTPVNKFLNDKQFDRKLDKRYEMGSSRKGSVH